MEYFMLLCLKRRKRMRKEKTFEESMNRLNELVVLLEKNETPLDETIVLFEEGLKLIDELEGKLKGYENKVSELLKASEERC